MNKRVRYGITAIFALISLSVFAAVVWDGGQYLQTYKNGILFGNFSVLDFSFGVPRFNSSRLDDQDTDIFFQEDFESSQSVSFTCGANLTASDETGSPISKNRSKVVTQAAGALNQNCQSSDITLDDKQKDTLIQGCITGKGENFDFVLYDSTNAQELGRVFLTDNQNTYCVEAKTESTTNAIAYRLEARFEVVSSEVKFDDVQFKTNPLSATEIYASEECEPYTPDTNGFGTISSITAEFCRNGEFMTIVGRFITGTVSTDEAQIGLPNGLTIGSDNPRFPCGQLYRDATSSQLYRGLCIPSSNFIRVGEFKNDANRNMQIQLTGQQGFGSSEPVTFNFRVPIAEWSDKTNGVVVKNLESLDIANTNGFSFKSQPAGTVSGENLDWINGNGSNPSTGIYDYTVNSGVFSAIPNCTAVEVESGATGNACYIDWTNTSSTNVRVACFSRIAGSFQNQAHNVDCQRSTDFVRESEKVYTIPIGFKESEFYYTQLQNNFWDNAGDVITWEKSTLQFPSPFSTSENFEILDDTTPLGTATIIRAKQNIELAVSVFGVTGNGQGVIIYDSQARQLGYTIGNASTSYEDSHVRMKLSKGDFIFFRNTSALNREGFLNIWAKPSKEEGLWLGTFGQPTCYISEQQPSGTVSTSPTVGNVQNTMTLNDLNGSCSFASLSSNQITLEKGTYNVEFYLPFSQNGNTNPAEFRGRFRNVTDSVTSFTGNGGYFRGSGNITGSINTHQITGQRQITINATKSFEVQLFTTTGFGSGIGRALGQGDPETYTQVKITRVR